MDELVYTGRRVGFERNEGKRYDQVGFKRNVERQYERAGFESATK